MTWAARIVKVYDLSGRSVLDVGSRDVNGSLRGLFTGSYIGVDMVDGPGVDRVACASDLPFNDGEFSVVICTEMLEHDLTFWRSLDEMKRVLCRGGHLLLSTRSNGFPNHDYPLDYYRFSLEAVSGLLEACGLSVLSLLSDDEETPGVLAVAKRPLMQ